MKHLIPSLLILILLSGSGCRAKKDESISPEAQFEGDWVHTIPSLEGQEQRIILRGTLNEQNQLVFKYLEQRYSYNPVFTRCKIVNENQIDIYFKLVGYEDGSDSDYKIRYSLKREGNLLKGQLFQSWKEPLEVALRKM